MLDCSRENWDVLDKNYLSLSCNMSLIFGNNEENDPLHKLPKIYTELNLMSVKK